MKPSDRLSEHFTLAELTRSGVALRRGIDNTPNAEEIAALKLLVAEVLEPVRKHFGVPFSPSSGFRALELNRVIGSKDTSQHVLGQAADIEVPGVSNRDLADWIMTNCKFDQLILEFFTEDDPSSGWVHVSVVEQDNRGAALTFDGREYRRIA